MHICLIIMVCEHDFGACMASIVRRIKFRDFRCIIFEILEIAFLGGYWLMAQFPELKFISLGIGIKGTFGRLK